MGLMNEAFGWMFGIGKKPIDQIDVEELEQKIRATDRLKGEWERDLKAAEAEYRKTMSVEANAEKSPVSRKLAIQRGAILARQVKTLSSAVSMLDKVNGALGQIRSLKQFYSDLTATSVLPKGLSIEDTLKQIYAMGDDLSGKQKELSEMLAVIDDANKAITPEEEDDGIDAMMSELNDLYDEYNEKVAMNDAAGAEAVRAKIDEKRAEMDRQVGMAAV